MHTLLATLRGVALATAILTACSSPNSNPNIAPQMRRINASYQAAQAATTLADFSAQLAQLRVAVNAAQAEMLVGSAQNAATYRDGMAELVTALNNADRAVASGDLAAAKTALGEMDRLRRSYHITLGL